jgi:hypothetical protein
VKFLNGLSTTMLVIIGIGYYVGGGLLHLFTTYLIFASDGLLLGTLSFFLPVLSQIYLVIKITSEYGFFNLYNYMTIFYLLLYPFGFLFGTLAEYSTNKLEAKERAKADKEDTINF